MTTYVAFLRGVNVGKGKRVPMAELRALLADLGCTDVATLRNSGNAVLRAERATPGKLAAAITAAIAARLDVEVPVVVKSFATLAAVVADNPLRVDAAEASRLLVAFAPDAKALAGLAPLRELIVAPEQFAIGTAAAYLYCAAGILESKAGEALLGKLGRAVTTRNWATVQLVLALAQQVDAAPDAPARGANGRRRGR